MSKHSKTMPKSEARPLGTKKPKKVSTRILERIAEGAVGLPPEAQQKVREFLAAGGKETDHEIVVDSAPQHDVDLSQSPIPANDSPGSAEDGTSHAGEKMMTITLKTLSKNGKQAYYSGAAQILRFPLGAFPNKTAPQTLEVPEGTFAGAKEPKTPKAQMTPEQKAAEKAARAAAPKPTLAERIARREQLLEKDRARLAAQANQPSL